MDKRTFLLCYKNKLNGTIYARLFECHVDTIDAAWNLYIQSASSIGLLGGKDNYKLLLAAEIKDKE